MRKLIEFIFPYHGTIIDRANKKVYYRSSKWFNHPYDMLLATYEGEIIRDINDVRGTLLINQEVRKV
jgi:hypothetical protein